MTLNRKPKVFPHIALNAQFISDQAGYRSAGVSNYAPVAPRQWGLHAEGATAHCFTASSTPTGLPAPGVHWHRRACCWSGRWRASAGNRGAPAASAQLQPDLIHGLMNVLPWRRGYPGS